MGEEVDSVILEAARLHLLTLAVVSRAASRETDRVTLRFDGRAAEGDPATALASLPKPLICSASVSGGALWAECARIEDRAGLNKHLAQMWALASESGIIGRMRRAVAPPADKVLILAGQDSLVVGKHAVEKWSEDYALPPRVALLEKMPNEEQKSSGVGFVILITRPDEVTPDQLRRDLDSLARDPIPPGQRLF